MTNPRVPSLALSVVLAVAASAAVAIFLPVALALFWRRRSGAPWRAL